MKKSKVYVVFDRKHEAEKKGSGKLEICIYFDRQMRKFVTISKATPLNWERMAKSEMVIERITMYEKILSVMEVLGEEMCISNFDAHLKDVEQPEEKIVLKRRNMYKGTDLDSSFTDYMEQSINDEDIRIGTRKHKICVLESIRRFGKLNTLADLTPANILDFDRWLRDGTRTDVTVYGYHKRLKIYTRQLRMADMIERDPYDQVRIKRGRSKERKPLTEEELKRMRDANLDGKLDRVRDLFIFAAYTGLSYSDTQLFEYKSMTEEIDGIVYINGTRLKTSTEFFTPILQPAMDVLTKYNYQLPHISNQKSNDFLHVIQEKLDFKKSLTFHVARHSFATMCLAHDVPIEDVAKMLGHMDVKTTQLYAKVMKKTINRHSKALSESIL